MYIQKFKGRKTANGVRSARIFNNSHSALHTKYKKKSKEPFSLCGFVYKSHNNIYVYSYI